MIRRLLDARDEETGEALSREALRNEAAVIFMAGHETTANSLAWCWYLLSQAPEVEARLHAELARVLGGRLPTLDDVPRLVYTRAVFEEAIRLYPPVPLLGRQSTHAETIRDRPIPVGSLVIVVPWLLHRHRRLWKNGPFHAGTVLAGKCVEPGKVQLCPFQRWSEGLRRSGFRLDRGDPVPGDPSPVRPVAACGGCRGRAGLPLDSAPRRHPADAVTAAGLVAPGAYTHKLTGTANLFKPRCLQPGRVRPQPRVRRLLVLSGIPASPNPFRRSPLSPRPGWRCGPATRPVRR
jgi:hypothetical protein